MPRVPAHGEANVRGQADRLPAPGPQVQRAGHHVPRTAGLRRYSRTLDTVCRQRVHRVEGGVARLQLGLASAAAVPHVVRGGGGRLAASGHQQVVH